MRAIVVGAGVVGLTVAVRLAEAGHRIDVVARDRPRETTSAIAAALWYPYYANPPDSVTRWAMRASEVFAELAEDPARGVRLRAGTEVFEAPAEDPWWITAVPSLERTGDLPAGFVDGWEFVAPIIEMPVYLDYLAARLEAAGGTLTRLNLASLPTPGTNGVDLVVNCSGLGARLLGSDQSVHPVQGQVMILDQIGLERWWLHGAAGTPTYVVPRSNDVVVGGTEAVGEWSRTPDPTVAAQIMARASRLVPELAGARIRQHRVGLRPARPEVRLERIGDVVHCYGHGGAGVTVSWGCADDVLDLVG